MGGDRNHLEAANAAIRDVRTTESAAVRLRLDAAADLFVTVGRLLRAPAAV